MSVSSTRELIVEKADSLFYEGGFEATSFAEIAAAVGISRGNFYHHFKTKDAILEAVIVRRMERTRAMLDGWQADLVCLAGFMRLLSAEFCTRWAGRLINIHPSLLPRHKGLHTHEQALADGSTTHGCTVHFVTPGMDEGPTIAQASVPILPGDTADTLAARVLVEEHKLYPAALAMVARGEARLS